MKLMIVGNHGTMVKRLIAAVRKADWEVYLLIGKTGSERKPAKVFEQFLFPYDSDSIHDVLDSVDPDIVVFTGLYDNTFDWSNLQKTSMEYLSGLVNLLNACDDHKGLRFVYLSSQEVFSPIQGDVTEDMQPKPTQERGLLIEQGERLVSERRLTRKLETTIVRLDHPYATLESANEYKDVFECMCVDACAEHQITLHAPNQRFSGINLNDVCEGLYRIMAAPHRLHRIYHLSCANTISERELAEKIAACSSDEVRIEEAADADFGEGSLHLLCENAKTEFGFHAWHSYDETVPLLYRHTQKHLGALKPDLKALRAKRLPHIRKRMRDSFHTLRPFLLNLVGFACTIVLCRVLERGGYTQNIDILLLYPLLFAGVYGKQQAVFSAALSVVYRFLSSDHLFTLMINYNTYLWVAEVFIVAMLVGHLRDQLETIKVETEEEVSTIRAKLTEMYSINESNKRIKLEYEKRLVEYNGSLGKLYKVTAELNALQPGEVLFSAVKAIADVMETKDVAIYAVANASYCRLFSSTSVNARRLGRSIKYPELTEMYEAITQHRVFINKKLDYSLPLMANGIFEGEDLTFIIMIWGLKLENLSLYHANQLSILCFLIMLSLNHASQYLKALEEHRYLAETRLLEPDAYTELLSLYLNASRQKLVEYTQLRIPAEGRSPQEINAILKTCTRASDVLGLRENGDVCVLLPNTTEVDAPIVIHRIEATGLVCTTDEQEG